MKVLRPLALVAAVFLALLIVTIVLLGSKLNGMVAAALEETVGALTGCEVRVASADISLREGTGLLRGVSIGNPAGFPPGDLFFFGEISLKLDGGTVTEETVVIDEFRIAKPLVRHAVDAAGRSAPEVFVDAVMADAPLPLGEGGAAAGGPDFLVRSVVFEEGRMEFDGGAPRRRPIKLPELVLRDVGAPRGRPAAAVGREILLAVGRAALGELRRPGIEGKTGGKPGTGAGAPMQP